MQSLSYSQLTEPQLAQAAYLFADAHFGTDANAYLYEVDGRGNVKGRSIPESRRQKAEGRAKRNSPVNVHTVMEVNITDRLTYNAQMNMDALAVSIAEKINQSQELEEVIK